MIVITRTMVQSDDIDIKNEVIRPFFQRDFYERTQLAKIYRIVIPKIPLFQILINHLKIAKIIHQEKPDLAIVVTPGIYSIPKNIPYLIKNGGNIYVYNAHRKFDSPYSAYIKIFGTLLYKFEKKLFRRAQKVISVSSFESNVLESVYNIKKEKLTHVLNGIDLVISNPPLYKRKKLKNIIYVGQLNDIKGIKYLFEAFSIIAPLYPNITLEVVGEGAFKEELSKFIQENNLKHRIIMHGYLPQPRLQQIYARSDLAIVPSIHDACPNTVLEAFGYSIPVLGSRVGGIPELIDNMKTGILFSSKNAPAIADAMKKVLDNPGLYNSLIENLMSERYNLSWFKRIDRFQVEIEKIIGLRIE